KKTLTSTPKAALKLSHNRKPVPLEVTRGDFQMESRKLLERCQKCLDDVLADIGMKWSGIDRVLIVGGASRMPMIRGMLKAASNHDLSTSLAPDVAIANGAALHAARLAGVNLGPG